ncbi:Wd-40 domain-containing protein, partial [Globisporangium splendens]
MFQDVALGSISFKSKCTKTTAHAATATATEPIEYAESSTEPRFGVIDGSTQTDPKATASTSSSAGKKDKKDTTDEGDATRRSVLESLERELVACCLRFLSSNTHNAGVVIGFEKYLEASAETNIAKLFQLKFDYDAYFVQTPSQSQASSSNIAKKTEPLTSSSLKLSCTGVSWNATGSAIAVAYGRFDHTGWCNYRSALCLWSVFHADFNPQKPTLVLETSSGLMCVVFHPKNPSLVAAGSFNGEVFVWDTEPEEYRFYASGIGDCFHREPVTKVAWVYDVQAAKYNIASVSGDGKVLFWRLKDKLAHPVEGYVMHLPGAGTSASNNSTHLAASGSTNRKGYVIGGKSLGFCSNDKTSRSFVVGSEGGAVTRCFSKGMARSSDFKGEKKWTAMAARLVGKLPSQRIPAIRRQVELYATEKKSKEITLAMVYEAKLDPNSLYPSAMDFAFEQHSGPVYDVSFSPFRKSLSLSCSSDGTARVYSYAQREPVLSLEVTPSSAYLYAIEWSRTRPMVFGVAAEDGNVYIYDLKVDHVNPVVVLSGKDPIASSTSTSSSAAQPPQSSKTPSSPMFSLDFNPRQRNFVAAGDASGSVNIWKLSWQLANLQSGEVAMLEGLEATTE